MADRLTGTVADIQRFSLHDGPGVRTSVFLKGCNLNCAWCHNPETIAFAPEVIVDDGKCIGCGRCDEGCFAGARRVVGAAYTVEELLAVIAEDREYYGDDGGVTLTGGEPLCQPDFALALLEACRADGIGRAMETNLHCDPGLLARAAALCDVVMCDLKLWDDDAHRRWVGVGNGRIKENLRVLSGTGTPFILRTVIVPGVSDGDEDIRAIAAFAASLPGLKYYELLGYHALGLSKRLEGKEPRQAFSAPRKERLEELALLAAREGVPVVVGGVRVREH